MVRDEEAWRRAVDAAIADDDTAQQALLLDEVRTRLAAAGGKLDTASLRGCFRLGEAADDACDWPLATCAWRVIVENASVADLEPSDRQMAASAARRLGARLLRTEPEAALELFRRDLAILEGLSSPSDIDLAIAFSNIATACERLGRIDDARAARRRQLAIVEASLGADHVNARVLREQLDGH